MSRVSVAPDPAFPAGRAVIRIVGAAAAINDPRFRLYRPDYQQGVLGPGGWQVGDAVLQPEHAEVTGGDLLLFVGADVTEHLEERPYQFALPAVKLEEVVTWPAIASEHDGWRPWRPSRSASSGDGAPATAREDVPNPDALGAQPEADGAGGTSGAAQDSTGHDAHAEDKPTPRPRGLFHAMLGVLALFVACGGAWYALAPHSAPQPAPSPAPPSPAPPSPVPPPRPELWNLPPSDVVKQAGSDAAIYAEGMRRLQAGQTNDGVDLIEEAALRGYPAANAERGRESDPGMPQVAGLNKSEVEAARYYQAAERGGDHSVAARRAALHDELKRRAAQGHARARQALRQYWSNGD